MKIGLLIIATNKYISFLNDLIPSADEFFLKGENVEYFIFSDHKSLSIKSSRVINLLHTDHKQWPWMTLGRYKIFSDNSASFKDMDYLFYCDADMRFCDNVGKEIIGGRTATQHPGFYGRRGTPETNPSSLAYVSPVEQMQYFAGGFNGGKREEYLKMSKVLSENIERDFENKIIAIWHDESHMNRYFASNAPTNILDPGYCYGESLKPPFRPRLLALDKNHKYLRA